jgi:hypothetical protein
MHFLDAWTSLPPADVARRLAPLALVGVAVLVPGPRSARAAALGIALLVPFMPGLDMGPAITALWGALWLFVAWQSGLRSGEARTPLATRLGGVESGAVGMLLAGALLALLVAVVAGLDIAPEPARRAAMGVAFVALGWTHLMLRRHVLRACVAFAAMGLGLELLAGVVRQAVVTPDAPPRGAVLFGTAVAVALAVRLAHARAMAAGNAWVSDAHDLHD